MLHRSGAFLPHTAHSIVARRLCFGLSFWFAKMLPGARAFASPGRAWPLIDQYAAYASIGKQQARLDGSLRNIECENGAKKQN
jgi:hypothetical protein